MANAQTYKTRDLTSTTGTIVPTEVVVLDSGLVLACYATTPDAPYDDLETLAEEHGLDVSEILACDSYRSEWTDADIAAAWEHALAHYPDVNQPAWQAAYEALRAAGVEAAC